MVSPQNGDTLGEPPRPAPSDAQGFKEKIFQGYKGRYRVPKSY